MKDGIAWIGRSSDLSRGVEPSAMRRTAEGRDDKGGFAALMDQSGGRDAPLRSASEPRETPETEESADEAGSSGENVGFEAGDGPSVSQAPLPRQEPLTAAGEAAPAPADVECLNDLAAGGAGALDLPQGSDDSETAAAAAPGDAAPPRAEPEAGWSGLGQAVAIRPPPSRPGMPGDRAEEATLSARGAGTWPAEPLAGTPHCSLAAMAPVHGVAASLLSSLMHQGPPEVLGDSFGRTEASAAARIADLKGLGGGAGAWTPPAPVFAATSLARVGSAFGAMVGCPEPAEAAPVAAPTGLASGVPVPAQGRSRGAGAAAQKGEGDPPWKLVVARPEPDKGVGDGPQKDTTSLGKPAARADNDPASSPEAAKVASPLVAGLRLREGRRVVGGREGGLEAPAVPPPGVGLAAPLDGPEGSPDARRILQQVATHPVLRTGGSAELNLAPEELGPLRLSVEMDEGGLRILIEAARPETADLMRRHVEALRQELRQEGLGSVGVSIGGGERRPGRDSSPDRGQGDGWPAPPRGGVARAETVAPQPRTATAAGHIDLRF